MQALLFYVANTEKRYQKKRHGVSFTAPRFFAIFIRLPNTEFY